MKKLTLTNRKDQKIVGEVELPERKPVGTCIVQHGHGSSMRAAQQIAMKDAFLEKGFVVFSFDVTNSLGESDGKFEDARLGLFCEDLEDVIAWAKQQDWYVGPLALTGHSMGGHSVAIYAEKHFDEVAYCAAIAPVISGKLIHEVLDPGMLEGWEESGWYISESPLKPGFIGRSPWEVMIEYKDHDLLPFAENLTMPTLLVVGGRDHIIPVKHIQKLFDAIPEGKKKLVVLESAGHTYHTEEHLISLKKEIKNWLQGRLQQ